MEATVDGEVRGYHSGRRGRRTPSAVSSSFSLNEIGAVAVDLVGAHMAEEPPPACVGDMLPRGSAFRRPLDVEIVKWSLGRQVMAGLGCGVNDQVELAGFE